MANDNRPLADSDFPPTSAPAQRALADAGYTQLEQLTTARAADLLKLHGVGPKAIRLLREALAARGWSFADEADG
jgi:hypothetical protein